MRKKHDALKQSFDELNATHERLKESHEKLEEAHSSFLAQEKKEPLATSHIGVTCDILDESFHTPIFVAPTNLSCSSSTTMTSSK